MAKNKKIPFPDEKDEITEVSREMVVRTDTTTHPSFEGAIEAAAEALKDIGEDQTAAIEIHRNLDKGTTLYFIYQSEAE